jgi:hypothetical protein
MLLGDEGLTGARGCVLFSLHWKTQSPGCDDQHWGQSRRR